MSLCGHGGRSPGRCAVDKAREAKGAAATGTGAAARSAEGTAKGRGKGGGPRPGEVIAGEGWALVRAESGREAEAVAAAAEALAAARSEATGKGKGKVAKSAAGGTPTKPGGGAGEIVRLLGETVALQRETVRLLGVLAARVESVRKTLWRTEAVRAYDAKGKGAKEEGPGSAPEDGTPGDGGDGTSGTGAGGSAKGDKVLDLGAVGSVRELEEKTGWGGASAERHGEGEEGGAK